MRSKWIAATRLDEGPDFEVSKSRVVTSALLAARVISDRFCLSIADSASNLFNFFFNDEELTSLLFCFLVRKVFFLQQFVLSALFTLLSPCKLRCLRSVSPVIILNIFSGLK